MMIIFECRSWSLDLEKALNSSLQQVAYSSAVSCSGAGAERARGAELGRERERLEKMTISKIGVITDILKMN